jgi:hypothetical protein
VSYLFPANPERLVERAAGPIFEELAAALEGVAEALAALEEAAPRPPAEP